MPIDLDALEKLAERCTHGDPWYADGDLRGRQTFGEFLPQDRAFIAAVSPQTVRELIRMARRPAVPDDNVDGLVRVTDPIELAVACGAISYSPPPMRAVRGVSMTFEQLREYFDAVLDLAAPASASVDICGITYPLNEGIPPAPPAVSGVASDTEMLDWIEEHVSSASGGNGFTLSVFVPVDSECLRDAIQRAIVSSKIVPTNLPMD